MRLDLVDLLRCPNDHADTALVCVAREARGRELVTATLGCPVCHAEFTIGDGVAWLGAGAAAAPVARSAGEGVLADGRDTAAREGPADRDSRTDVVRLAAMLDLSTPGGTVALSGSWSASARALAELTACAVVVLADDPRWLVPDLVSVIAAARGVPLARASLRGIALGTESAVVLDARLSEAAAALAQHGRLVAPVSCVAPPTCHEVARDDRWWVAERRELPESVSLRRAPPRAH